MPTYKISQLTTATAVSATNQFEINQNGTSKSVEVSVIDAYIKSTSNLPVVVSVSSATNAVRITQTGTGNALVVEDAANPDSSPFVVDTNGNLGMGTTSPAGRVDIQSNDNSAQQCYFRNSNAGSSAFSILNLGNDSSATAFRLLVPSSTGTSFGGANSANLVNSLNSPMTFWTNNTERMRIDATGNVGIGTTSAGSKLDVKGTLRLSGATSGYVGLAPAAAAGSTTYTLPAADGTSGQVLSTNGSGTLSWASSGGGFASGTAMLFIQTAAPTGWTKSVAHDNKALRVVSGTASSGGTVAFTTAFASQAVSGTVGSTTLSTAQIPSHTHTYGELSGNCGGLNGGGPGIVGGNTGATGGGGSHNHSFTGTAINLAVQYVDAIIATKD